MDLQFSHLELLLLEAMTALASNDSVDEVEYLRLLKIIVIVYSFYHEEGFFGNLMSLVLKRMFPGAAPRNPQIFTRFAVAA